MEKRLFKINSNYSNALNLHMNTPHLDFWKPNALYFTYLIQIKLVGLDSEVINWFALSTVFLGFVFS